MSDRHRLWCRVALKRVTQINGINGVAITKLGVLEGLETIKVCIAYEYRGKCRELAPLDADGWDECKPAKHLGIVGCFKPSGRVAEPITEHPSMVR